MVGDKHAANPTFARIGSGVSFDMLKSLRRAIFTFQNLKRKNPKSLKDLENLKT